MLYQVPDSLFAGVVGAGTEAGSEAPRGRQAYDDDDDDLPPPTFEESQSHPLLASSAIEMVSPLPTWLPPQPPEDTRATGSDQAIFLV